MKKQYKAMGALALATAFIAINGVVVDASPLGTNNYYVGANVHTGSNSTHDNTTGGNEIPIDRTADDTHGEWVVVKEPTYTEDGLRKRGYTSDDGSFHVEFESIQRLMPTPVLPVVPPQPQPSLPEESQTSRPTDNSTKFENNKHHGSSKKKRNVESAKNNGDAKTLSDKTPPSKSESLPEQSVADTKNTVSEADNKRIEKKSKGGTNSKVSERKTENTVSQKDSVGTDTKTDDSKDRVSEKTDESKVTESAASNETNAAQKQGENNTKAVGKKVDTTPVQTESTKASRSFNGYDGVTILAAGAYTWWIAIVLLPMIDAFKWINKKRREKSRGNVNKKHN